MNVSKILGAFHAYRKPSLLWPFVAAVSACSGFIISKSEEKYKKKQSRKKKQEQRRTKNKKKEDERRSRSGNKSKRRKKQAQKSVLRKKFFLVKQLDLVLAEIYAPLFRLFSGHFFSKLCDALQLHLVLNFFYCYCVESSKIQRQPPRPAQPRVLDAAEPMSIAATGR